MGKAFQWSIFVERLVIRARELGSGLLLWLLLGLKSKLKIWLVVPVKTLKAVNGLIRVWISVEMVAGGSGCCC